MFFAIHASDRNIWFWWGFSVCFSFFVCVWENVEEGASAYFSAWLSIWLPICLLFYLLPAETQHTFCGEICKPRRPAQQMLFRKDDILPVSSHTLFCAFETGTTTNMKASGNMPLTFQQPPFFLVRVGEPQHWLLPAPLPMTALEPVHGMKWIPCIFKAPESQQWSFRNISLDFQEMNSCLQAVLVV